VGHRLSFFPVKSKVATEFFSVESEIATDFYSPNFLLHTFEISQHLGMDKQNPDSTHSRTPAENRSLQLQLNSVAAVMDRASMLRDAHPDC
jgi:hypothetical protein